MRGKVAKQLRHVVYGPKSKHRDGNEYVNIDGTCVLKQGSPRAVYKFWKKHYGRIEI